MKKFVKVLSWILVFMLVISPVISIAAPTINVPQDGEDLFNLGTLFGNAAGVIKFVGYGIAVIMVLWLGIQYMLAQPAKKAELKGKMWSMLIGIVLLVAGTTILSMIWDATPTVIAQ